MRSVLSRLLTLLGPGFRTHRPAPHARGEDDGTNPLLQREGGSGGNFREREVAVDVTSQLGRFGGRAMLPRVGESFIQDLVATMGGQHGGHAINVTMEPPFQSLGGQLPPVFAAIQNRRGGQALIDIDPNRPWREQLGGTRIADILPRHLAGHPGTHSPPSSDEAQAVEFRPIPTVVRWQEEARMLFSGKHHEKATRIINALLRLLVPPAMEEKKQRDKAEAERKAAEEKSREEERKKAEAEKTEREAQEKKEREEREAREAEEARAREQVEREAGEDDETQGATSDNPTMEGVEQSKPAESADAGANAQSASQANAPATERITTTIRGRELDITNLGIDLDYLNALPEEMREEVIMSQFAEQRATAAQSDE